jgi:Antitoxin VbhA
MAFAVQISSEERAKRLNQITQALASVRLEGLEPGEEALAIFERYAQGHLTLEEMGAAIDALHNGKYGPLSLSGDDDSQEPS